MCGVAGRTIGAVELCDRGFGSRRRYTKCEENKKVFPIEGQDKGKTRARHGSQRTLRSDMISSTGLGWTSTSRKGRPSGRLAWVTLCEEGGEKTKEGGWAMGI